MDNAVGLVHIVGSDVGGSAVFIFHHDIALAVHHKCKRASADSFEGIVAFFYHCADGFEVIAARYDVVGQQCLI